MPSEDSRAFERTDEFLATVSHELRTPLNAIVGWTRLLACGQLDAARTAHAIDTIDRNAKALTRIIDDLLDISRIVGGSIRIDLLPVDLIAVIQGALDEVRPAAEAKGVDLIFTPPTVTDPVGGDSVRLQQVVANLLSNAVKFTPAGGLVEVRLTSIGAHAEIRVADTGEGIAPEFVPRLFDHFSQADKSPSRRHGGIGLGLTIVKALVERHGGTVHAESPGPGKGATFTVRIPVLASPTLEVTGPRMVDTRGSASRRLDGVRVLLVENDTDGRQLLSFVLEIAGATVQAVTSARAALDALEVFRPDVLISDIGMPDEDGYALIRDVRARDADRGGRTPAIALTGYVGPEDESRLLASGFQLHVHKPAEPADIVTAVASLVAPVRARP